MGNNMEYQSVVYFRQQWYAFRCLSFRYDGYVIINFQSFVCLLIFCFSDKDESRKKREEKRIQRQKEIEAKRNARQGASTGGGSLKLGGKKI